jgi:hypothetical protein
MDAVVEFARLDLRRRWRSLVVLALLITLAGGVILAALAGARRTASVVTRLDRYIAPADVMVLPNQPGFNWAPIRKLPSVEALGKFALTENVAPQAEGLNFGATAGFPPGDLVEHYAVDRPRVLSGRLPDPRNPTEILASPGFVPKYGKVVSLTFPSKAQLANLRPGESPPPGTAFDGEVVQLRVVGVGVNTFDVSPGGGPVFGLTHAFFAQYIKPVFPYFENARIRLKGGEAAIPEFTKELARATGNPNLQVDNAHAEVRNLQRTATFTAVSWTLFASIAFLASLVLLGQAFVRYAGGAAEDLATLGALGMDQRQARLSAASGPLLASFAGAIGAVGVAVAISPLFPTALTAKYEPDPGVSIDKLVLGGGVLLIILLGTVGSLVAARAATHVADETVDRASTIATIARRAGLGVSAVLGTRFALEPGRGKTRVPVRPALVGAVAGVLGVVGALIFRDGLSSAVDNLPSYGQTFKEFGFVSEGPPRPQFYKALKQAAGDPDLAVLDDMRVSVLNVNGRPVSTTSITPVVGEVHVVALSGQAPVGPNEIALGPQTAKDLNVHPGSTVTVDGHQMTVSGITFVPQNPHNDYTDGGWLTTAGFAVVRPDQTHDKFHEIRFTFRPGVNEQAGYRRLPQGLAPGGMGRTEDFIVPEQQIELRSVRLEPMLLGGFLLLLAIGAVGHGLATAVRRRRHDVAVLRALGLTRWQTRMIVVAQATMLALVGLVIGVPLGIAAGRTGWRVLAHATPVLYVPPLAVVVLLLSVPVTIVVANILATLPARRAVRLRVSEILRAE